MSWRHQLEAVLCVEETRGRWPSSLCGYLEAPRISSLTEARRDHASLFGSGFRFVVDEGLGIRT
jgi:hypothetical protein